jgi:hypothetical protein
VRSREETEDRGSVQCVACLGGVRLGQVKCVACLGGREAAEQRLEHVTVGEGGGEVGARESVGEQPLHLGRLPYGEGMRGGARFTGRGAIVMGGDADAM